MPLSLVITDAGRAALINAANTGTAPSLIAQVGLTQTAFTATAATTSLPSQLKTLTTFGGDAVAHDTIHLTIRDESSEAYTLRGIGLYLDGGTLFASYGQADPIVEKTSASLMLLALDISLQSIDVAAVTFGSTDFLNPPATEEVAGVVRLATDAEAAAGVVQTRAVAPRGLKAALDGRFGAGAPSDFFKGLLNLATAALTRAALGLGTAAQRNEGSGYGLDADLLDGQHGDWHRDRNNHTGIQSMETIGGLQAALDDKLPVAHGGSGGASHALATPAAAGFMAAADKSKLDGIAPGATANASNAALRDRATHTGEQAIGTVTGLQGALDGKLSLTGGTVSGLLTINRATQRDQISAGPGYNGGVPTGAGDKRIAVYAWDGAPSLYVSRHNVNGFELAMLADGGIRLGYSGAGTDVAVINPGTRSVAWNVRPTFNGNLAFDAGNFHPALKANLSGADFTGPLRFATNNTNVLPATAGGFLSFAGLTTTDTYLSVAFGYDGSNRRFYINRWNNVTGAYIENLMFFGQDGTVNVVAADGLRVGGNPAWHSGNFDPASKQNALGYTPVRQGGGAGQLDTPVKIGWSGTRLKAQVDATDLGNIVFDADFNGLPKDLAAIGYAKLPGGLIVQWGYVSGSLPAEGTVAVSYPISFPGQCVGIHATLDNPGELVGLNAWTQTKALGLASATLYVQRADSGSPAAGSLRWWAIGF